MPKRPNPASARSAVPGRFHSYGTLCTTTGWGLPSRLVALPRLLRHALALALLFVACVVAQAQNTVKSIEGKVLSAQSAPIPGSIIYLQDTKTNVIKTLIAPTDGSYHFGQLPADTDYQVWAEYKGKKSKVRLVNSFDSKLNVTCNFHISDK